MIAAGYPPRLRVINILIPPTNDPLLTPYQRKINPKIVPLKRNFSILSNTKEFFQVKQQKLQLSKNDIEKINRSYQSLKKFKKTYLKQTVNEQEKYLDPSYLNLIKLRKSSLLKKKTAQKLEFFKIKTTSQSEEKQLSFLRLTELKQRSRTNRDRNNSIFDKQHSRYQKEKYQQQKFPQSMLSQIQQKKSPRSAKYFCKK